MAEAKIEKEINGEVVELVPANEIIPFVFVESVNETTLKDLRKKYPKKLNLDMSVEADFKAARKIKTEFNKITKEIDARRINYCAEVKEHGDKLIEEFGKIYTPYVAAFEVENKRQKDEKARIAKEREEFLNVQRKEIQGIKNFVETCKGQSALFIADTIQAVEEIDTDAFDKELIHEAIEIKKDVRSQLDALYDAAKNQERLESERAELEAQQALLAKEQAERQKLIDEENERNAKAAKIEGRINNLRNDSNQYRDKSSAEIKARIAELVNFTPKSEYFGDRVDEVAELMVCVLADHRDRLEMVEFKEAKQAREYEQQEKARQDEAAKNNAENTAVEEQVVNEVKPTNNEFKALEDPTEEKTNLFGKSKVFESMTETVELEIYTPLDVWPSDESRNNNHDLHIVCCQLEKAESTIKKLLSK